MTDGKPLREAPAAAGGPKADHVGNEKKADMHGALEGSPTQGLRGAVDELKKQHPERYDDLGPHQGSTAHIRHVPLHGMKPTGKYSK
jgi:hypothetical protein